jgi:3-keto-L-gulonate-6-phosphate decarboxylase
MEGWGLQPLMRVHMQVMYHDLVRVSYGTEDVGLANTLGSNVIVAGTAIFGAENPEAVIAGLKESVNQAFALRNSS